MSVSPYITNPNIMDDAEYSTKSIHLTYGARKTIKAGMPISAAGEVKNDGNAIGILLLDCHKGIGSGYGLVVIAGRINAAVAASHSGITISDAAKSNMPNIAFTGDTGKTVLPSVSAEDADKFLGVDEDGAVKALPVEFPASGFRIHSSTADSEKVFLITVDDDGELTATEEVAPTEE